MAPFRSAMSMLTIHVNRAGANSSASRKNRLQIAKTKLREIFGRKPKGRD